MRVRCQPCAGNYHAIMLCLCLVLPAVLPGRLNGEPSGSRKLTIEWKKVTNATRYTVQITDSGGATVLTKTQDGTVLTVDLAPGAYYMRIGAVNKFGKIESWSDWSSLTVPETGEEEVPRDVDARRTGLGGLGGLKIGVGYQAGFLMPGRWKETYGNTPASFNAVFGYTLGCHPGLSGIAPLRYIGLEGGFSYFYYHSRAGTGKNWNRSYDMRNMLFEGGLYATTRFRVPVNIIGRFGGGVAVTEAVGRPGRNMSRDPFYSFGLSVEYTCRDMVFVEAGTGYYSIKFLPAFCTAVTCFVRFGVKL